MMAKESTIVRSPSARAGTNLTGFTFSNSASRYHGNKDLEETENS